jgi:hypothetical protein
MQLHFQWYGRMHDRQLLHGRVHWSLSAKQCQQPTRTPTTDHTGSNVLGHGPGADQRESSK